MATLVCRSCREPVEPGDIICGGCRANLTALDAVIDPDQLPAVPDADDPPAGAEPPAEDLVDCGSCGEPLPAGTPLCPHCLRPTGGGVVIRLDGQDAPGQGWRHLVPAGGSVVLGRDPQQSPMATLLGPFDIVSRRHARVSVDAGRRVTVTDLGSTNGTFVDDVQVATGVDVDLPAGSRLRLGSSVLLSVEPA